MTGEFDLIQRYFVSERHDPDVLIGIGDDAAVLQLPPSQRLVVTTDTLNSGVHFPVDTSPTDIAYKAIAVNVSDLAAMGAIPKWATLNLTLPRADEIWLQAFARTFHDQLKAFNMQLIGGDTTRGPLSITVTAFGVAEPAMIMRRDAAQVGDFIAVTGTLGDARLGLDVALAQRTISNPDHRHYLLQRLHRPTARVHHSRLMRGCVHAAIDVSDGLAQDLSHVLQRSQCGAVLALDKLPLSSALRFYLAERDAFEYALCGGDDYELLFTLAPEQWPVLQSRLFADGLMATVIGRVIAQPGLQVQVDGKSVDVKTDGFQHF